MPPFSAPNLVDLMCRVLSLHRPLIVEEVAQVGHPLNHHAEVIIDNVVHVKD